MPSPTPAPLRCQRISVPTDFSLAISAQFYPDAMRWLQRWHGGHLRNTCKPTAIDALTFEKTTVPTPAQQRALDLLTVKLGA